METPIRLMVYGNILPTFPSVPFKNLHLWNRIKEYESSEYHSYYILAQIISPEIFHWPL